MSEYWKSTPKYWCKHCACYVRDTKLDRQNHEATGKHQGALKRFLRDLHRGHEKEERDKERAKREIARLNGVDLESSSAGPSRPAASAKPSLAAAPTEASLKKQREQLAELGVAMPGELRPEMAIAGDWTVTSTRIIETRTDDDDEKSIESRATGVRKREATEDEKAEEEAVRGLFKRPRKWGRDSKRMPHEDDAELDALLSGSTFRRPKAEPTEAEDVKKEEDTSEEKDKIKAEEDIGEETRQTVKSEAVAPVPPIKAEEGTEPGLNPVVFKKRKPKNIRQK